MDGNKRPRRRHRSAVEGLKNLLLVLLTLSAVLLAARALTYNELAGSIPRGWLGNLVSLLRPGNELSPVPEQSGGISTMPVYPARIAIYNDGKRFAVQYDTDQSNKVFDSVSILLSEALASASDPRQIRESDWRAALQSPGVWFDFPGSVPLSVLYAWLSEGGSNPVLTAPARQAIVALGEDGFVALYYHNETNGLYYACRTSVVYQNHMDELLAGYVGNSATFAFEFDAQAGYSGLAPYVLVFSSPPSPSVYHASNPLNKVDDATVESLQQAVSFRPQNSNSVYPVPGGLRVREGQETMLIGTDGTVVYSAGEKESSRYPVSDESEGALPGWLDATWTLASNTVGSYCGQATLYLMDVNEQEDGSLVVRYGYRLDGIEVVCGNEGCAARFTIRDSQITDYTLYFRSYAETGEQSLVLRELQAAAAMDAIQPEGRELVLCYTDNGGERIEAGWVAR